MKRNAAFDALQLSLVFDAPASLQSLQQTEPPRGRTSSNGRRRIALGQESLDYRLRRARRRSIGFQIDDGGLMVSAPRWVSLAEIEAAIVEKQRWIRTRIAEWRDWRRRHRLHELLFDDGGLVPYLGTHLTLRLRAGVESTHLHATHDASELHLALPTQAGEQQVRDVVQAWLQAQARRVFGERVSLLAAPLAPQLRGWSLSSARSQWGSCTHDGRIRLNWRLIHFSLPVIDYVIAHELAHLSEMNHGPRFWAAVGELLPGFEAARDEIKGVDLGAIAF